MANEQKTSKGYQGEAGKPDSMIASARTMASDAMDKASETVTDAVSAAAAEGGSRLTDMVDQQIKSASQYVTLISNTARSGADSLEQEAPQLARVLRNAAQRSDEFAHMLEDKSYSDMVEVAGRYIRSNPRVFLGGAVVVGFVMARLLKDLVPDMTAQGGRQGVRSNARGAQFSGAGGYEDRSHLNSGSMGAPARQRPAASFNESEAMRRTSRSPSAMGDA